MLRSVAIRHGKSSRKLIAYHGRGRADWIRVHAFIGVVYRHDVRIFPIELRYGKLIAGNVADKISRFDVFLRKDRQPYAVLRISALIVRHQNSPVGGLINFGISRYISVEQQRIRPCFPVVLGQKYGHHLPRSAVVRHESKRARF